MTFPEFCARQARRSAFLIGGLVALVAGAIGDVVDKQRRAAGEVPSDAGGAREP